MIPIPSGTGILPFSYDVEPMAQPSPETDRFLKAGVDRIAVRGGGPLGMEWEFVIDGHGERLRVGFEHKDFDAIHDWLAIELEYEMGELAAHAHERASEDPGTPWENLLWQSGSKSSGPEAPPVRKVSSVPEV